MKQQETSENNQKKQRINTISQKVKPKKTTETSYDKTEKQSGKHTRNT